MPEKQDLEERLAALREEFLKPLPDEGKKKDWKPLVGGVAGSLVTLALAGSLYVSNVLLNNHQAPHPSPSPKIESVVESPSVEIPTLPVPTNTPLPVPTSTPVQSPAITYNRISLNSVPGVVHESSNLGMVAGTNYFFGIPFETGSTATTQCSDRSYLPTSMNLDVNVDNPRNVYMLIQAGWGMQQYAGRKIGSVSLVFDENNVVDVPLILGDNIRDWSRNYAPAVDTATSPNLVEVVSGYAPDGRQGGIDMLTIDIPDGYHNSTLNFIQIYDTSTATTGSQDPCIHLLAVTVESLQ